MQRFAVEPFHQECGDGATSPIDRLDKAYVRYRVANGNVPKFTIALQSGC